MTLRLSKVFGRTPEGWIHIKTGYFRKLCVCNVF